VKFRPLLYLAIALAFYFVSGAVERRGDAAPFVEGGVSSERATYHIAALVLLIAAIGFLITAVISYFRNRRR
jgi:hypothetical protein